MNFHQRVPASIKSSFVPKRTSHSQMRQRVVPWQLFPLSTTRNSVMLPEHKTQNETKQILNIFDISTCTLGSEENKTP